jgi:hypothetical protein
MPINRTISNDRHGGHERQARVSGSNRITVFMPVTINERG